MRHRENDYKEFYEDALLTLSKKEEKISDLLFEPDKLRWYLYGLTIEKHADNSGVDQLGFFELGTTIFYKKHFSSQ